MPLIFYRCALCKREFDDLDAAKDCEASHAKVKKASAKLYTIGPYPFTIEVQFSDGKTKSYILEDMAHTLPR